MITLQTADAALKSVYLDVVKEQLTLNVNPLLAAIKRTTNDVWGKDIRTLARHGVNGGIGAGSEDGNLPTPSSNQYCQFVSTLKNLYGTIEISDKAIRASENNAGAFVNLLNDEMQQLVKSAEFNFGRMLFGDGVGRVATITANTTTTLTLDTVQNVAEGMILDLIDSNNAVVNQGRGIKIDSVNRTNKTVTFSNINLSGLIQSGDGLAVQGSSGKEITGLEALFKTSGTLYGVDISTNPWIKPYQKGSIGSITEAKIQTAIDAIEESSGGKVNFIVCSNGVKRALMNYFTTYKRINDTLDLKGGFKAMSFNGIPVVSDRFCPAGTMYFLNTDDFAVHQLCDWKWIEDDNGSVLKQVANKPVYRATLVKYADLICNKPCGQGKLYGITEA